MNDHLDMAVSTSAPPRSMKSYALRFISGKYQGGEFTLPSSGELIVGRSSDQDMVLVEDMVSRRHARILVDDEGVAIEDMGSTNGTFVNGERVKRVRLSEGDRVLIGTSIMKLVGVDVDEATEVVAASPDLEALAEHRRTSQVRSMTGNIEEVPLPDLLQLFSSSKKSGVLVVRCEADVGKLYLEQGNVVFASLNDNEDIAPEKAVYRILCWQRGTFYMEGPEEREFPTRLETSTEGLLMEGMRRLDEINRLREELPPDEAFLSLPSPLRAPLRDLEPEELDALQHVLNHRRLQGVLNNVPDDDLKLCETIAGLVRKGYVVAE